MGISTAFETGTSALNAAQTAIQITGHNISNAGNADYARQRVAMTTRSPIGVQGQFIGTGVDVQKIERIFNRQVESLLRDSRADLGGLVSKEQALSRLEGILNELDGVGLSQALSQFFDAAENLASQPQDLTARRLFITSAESLSTTFQNQHAQIIDLRRDLNSQVEDAVASMNDLVTGIADLNKRILFAEKGGLIVGNANDLRTRRDALVNQLSEIVDVRVQETDKGALNVSVGSDFLVENTTASTVSIDERTDGGVQIFDIRMDKNNKLLRPTGGRLAGILEARDDIVVGVSDELSELAQGIIFEINKTHSGGEGLIGYSSIEAENFVNATDSTLTRAGLEFTPQTGSFDLKVSNANTGLEKTFNIRIDLDGLNADDTTLSSMISQINTAVGTDFPDLTASVTPEGRLRLASSNRAITYRFSNDTSNVLASLGMGTFFQGSDANTIQVAQNISDDPRLVATGLGDGPADPRNIQNISNLRDSKVLQNQSTSFEQFYQGMVGVLGVRAQEAKELLKNQEIITQHLENERAAISGVNVDEEAVELLRFQRIYQGAARYISVVDSIMETLVNLI